MASGQQEAAQKQGIQNAAKPPKAGKVPGAKGSQGGGGNASIPASGEGMDRNASRGQDGSMGVPMIPGA
jgi:hypothetical protein